MWRFFVYTGNGRRTTNGGSYSTTRHRVSITITPPPNGPSGTGRPTATSSRWPNYRCGSSMALFLFFLFFAPNIIPTHRLYRTTVQGRFLYQFRNSNLFHHFQVEKEKGEILSFLFETKIDVCVLEDVTVARQSLF